MAKAKKTTSDETKKPTARKTRTKKTETKPVEEKVSEVLEGQGTEQSVDEQPKPIGTLFDTINYTNLQDLDKFVQNRTSSNILLDKCLVILNISENTCTIW